MMDNIAIQHRYTKSCDKCNGHTAISAYYSERDITVSLLQVCKDEYQVATTGDSVRDNDALLLSEGWEYCREVIFLYNETTQELYRTVYRIHKPYVLTNQPTTSTV